MLLAVPVIVSIVIPLAVHLAIDVPRFFLNPSLGAATVMASDIGGSFSTPLGLGLSVIAYAQGGCAVPTYSKGHVTIRHMCHAPLDVMREAQYHHRGPGRPY